MSASIRKARRTAGRQCSPHGEQAIYDGSCLLGVVTWRAGFSHARSATGRRLGKFSRANDAMAAVCRASNGDDAGGGE
jgi:hypothetical protein